MREKIVCNKENCEERKLSNRKRINSLQVLRVIAFLCVFACHGGLSDSGALGVSIFIILSGFLMFYSYSDRDISCSIKNNFLFTKKKIEKLYWLHIAMMFLVLLYSIKNLIVDFDRQLFRDEVINVVLHTLLIQSWIPFEKYYYSLNGVMWYLSTVTFFYFMSPYIIRYIKKIDSIKKTIILSIGIYIIQILFIYYVNEIFLVNTGNKDVATWLTYISPIFRLGDFIIGCNIGYLFVKCITKRNFFIYSVLEVVSLLLIIGAQYIHNTMDIGYFKNTVLYTPVVVLVILLVSYGEGVISKILTNKFLIYLGDISGYCYVIHQVVMAYVYTLFTKLNLGHNKLLHNTICIIFTVLAAIVWKKWGEKRENI